MQRIRLRRKTGGSETVRQVILRQEQRCIKIIEWTHYARNRRRHFVRVCLN